MKELGQRTGYPGRGYSYLDLGLRTNRCLYSHRDALSTPSGSVYVDASNNQSTDLSIYTSRRAESRSNSGARHIPYRQTKQAESKPYNKASNTGTPGAQLQFKDFLSLLDPSISLFCFVIFLLHNFITIKKLLFVQIFSVCDFL